MQISQHSVKGYLTFILHVYCVGQTFESPQRMKLGSAQQNSVKLSWLLLIIFLSFNSLTDKKKAPAFPLSDQVASAPLVILLCLLHQNVGSAICSQRWSVSFLCTCDCEGSVMHLCA